MEAPKQRHIIMLPFMAQGHLNPFLALAIQLKQRSPDLTVTMVSTPLNIRYLSSALSGHSQQHRIDLVSLPFDSPRHGLPPDSENTDGLPLDRIVDLLRASSSLEPHFRLFVSGIVDSAGGVPPACIVSDVFTGWAGAVAESYGSVNVCFTTGGAYGTAAYMSLYQNLPHREAVSDASKDGFTLPGFPDSKLFYLSQLHKFLRFADGNDEWSEFYRTQISNSLNSFGFLCNTVEEIETLGLQILREYVKVPVWCVGPLLPPVMTSSSSETEPNPGPIGQRTGKKPGISPEKCVEWLNLYPPRSVLYISFGSQNTISQSQMMELAYGLEESPTPFIWVIRPPLGYRNTYSRAYPHFPL